MNAWIYLSFAIVAEVIGTSFIKLSDGFTHPIYTGLCLLCFTAALFLLSQSVKQIDISVVYAIWSGVGIALITAIGVLVFNEQLSLSRGLFIVLIAIGVVGLQMTSSPALKNPSAQEGG